MVPDGGAWHPLPLPLWERKKNHGLGFSKVIDFSGERSCAAQRSWFDAAGETPDPHASSSGLTRGSVTGIQSARVCAAASRFSSQDWGWLDPRDKHGEEGGWGLPVPNLLPDLHGEELISFPTLK